MRIQSDVAEASKPPIFLNDAKELHRLLLSYDRQQLKNLFKANDKITELNYQRFRQMDLDHGLTPAVLAYVGLQYQSMAPDIFTRRQWDYVKAHLKILSGFYGLLDAMDGVVPYRLEMQAKLAVGAARDLYGFWGSRIYDQLVKDDRIILNLASKEYSRAVEPYLEPDILFLSCVFLDGISGELKVKATAAKMARGEMVRWLAEEQISDPADVRNFTGLGYQFCSDLSTLDTYTFIRNESTVS